MIDAHAHLDDRRFADDLDAVMARASAAGVERVLSCAGDLASSERTVLIARRYPSVRVAVGVHPHHAGSWSDAVSGMVNRLARDQHVVAIGEIGMDLSGRSAPREAQETAFLAQLALARALDLPVVVHVRESGPVARELIDRAGGARGMVHCYSEGADEVGEWMRRGFAVSFAGTVTYPKNGSLRLAAAGVTADRILVETDAPYLAPQARRGERNEPAFVLETLAAVAAARGEEPAELGRQVGENARKLFGDRF
ncbi:MAG TPA: TatD family hydrolase [Candidatus Limnocylindria bacterium]|nr:TatD family hydrolase [Candidatus Limnocylindria bacterium]